jgi:hypothetical protein
MEGECRYFEGNVGMTQDNFIEHVTAFQFELDKSYLLHVELGNEHWQPSSEDMEYVQKHIKAVMAELVPNGKVCVLVTVNGVKIHACENQHE